MNKTNTCGFTDYSQYQNYWHFTKSLGGTSPEQAAKPKDDDTSPSKIFKIIITVSAVVTVITFVVSLYNLSIAINSS
ncbi:hypothetical protein LSH36_296g04007 [Paralvinella palmiformis]|uniref:Uncharacterized protein n=1 Tax=Paralvinella palmiformis TaxID=53620 RepID=A0AAD9N407_9ANNE|nr:hypothetical protein LSH36_296g04007 [Paralvinella palmiformis]